MNPNDHRLALPAGSQLNDLQIENVLGHGGFGITYKAWDRYLEQYVAVKEYLPNEIATRVRDYSVRPQSTADRGHFEWGLERFLDEARILNRFEHPNILRVIRFFEAHQTAYMVTRYEEGRTFTVYLEELGRAPSETELRLILMPLLDGLETVHDADFLHRDIKPGNIYICSSANRPVLIDFGSARQSLGSRTKSMTSILTPGYAPFEQYTPSGKRQGAWTDIYSMAAVLHRAVTGKIPPDASDRHDAVSYKEPDPLTPLSQLAGRRYSPQFVNAVEKGLRLLVTERPQSVEEWRKMFGTPKKMVRIRENSVKVKVGRAKPKQLPSGNGPKIKINKNWLARIAILFILIFSASGIYFFGGREGWWQRSKTPEKPEIHKPAVIKTGSVEVLTQPPGAAIFIAGKKKGMAPVTLKNLAPGNLTIEADELAGYNAARKTVKITAGGETRVMIELSAAFGQIVITSEPSDAQWQLDSKPMGETPGNKANIKPGRYSVTVTHKGYEDWKSDITVTAGKKTTMNAVLVKIPQTIAGVWTEDLFTEMEFVRVKGGSFHMGDQFGDGSSDEKPVHKVRVHGFYMGKYEVTQGQWRAIMGANPSGFKKGDNYPVERVSWDDAQKFIRKLNRKTGKNFRLPTEAEWEFTARSGGKKEKYAGSDSADEVAWYGYEKSGESTHPKGEKKPNGLGLYDMSGNVWEWCSDWYGENYYNDSPRDNPKGPSSGSLRVIRGGSWGYSPRYVRAAYRRRYAPGGRDGSLGFRLVLPGQ